MKRFVILVIDSFGIGQAPDAHEYGDVGASTALHICEKKDCRLLKNLCRLGLGQAGALLNQKLIPSDNFAEIIGAYGVIKPVSPGKDTTTGHWEMGDIVLDKPFAVFPPEYPSFPQELTDAFCKEIGRGILGNIAASGTEIIKDLGEEHVKTGFPIVYTSADSVLQIAAHESVVPIEQLYQWCKIARKLCDPYQVARVIARPFTGEIGDFKRTERRKDYSIPLPKPSVMDVLKKNGVETVAVGKISNIFNDQGISINHPDKGNTACLKRTLDILKSPNPTAHQFIFVNLVDTDMLYGHRRDIEGYFNALQEIDNQLTNIMSLLGKDDILVITADHGCDPGFKGTDHTREYVPLLVYQPKTPARNLGIRNGMTEISASAYAFFALEDGQNRTTFL